MGAIARNKTRAALTVLGILIGITAVVIVSALAESTSSQVAGKIDSWSANGLFVFPRPVQASGARAKTVGRLTENDGRAIAREAVSVAAVAPWLGTQGQVVFGDQNWATEIGGTTLPYFGIRRWTIGKGSVWTESDEILKTKVCVIGQTVATNLFGDDGSRRPDHPRRAARPTRSSVYWARGGRPSSARIRTTES